MNDNEAPKPGRGFAGKLADPQVRLERSRKAAAASAAARRRYAQDRQLQEMSHEERRELLTALVATECREALEELRRVVEERLADDGVR